MSIFKFVDKHKSRLRCRLTQRIGPRVVCYTIFGLLKAPRTWHVSNVEQFHDMQIALIKTRMFRYKKFVKSNWSNWVEKLNQIKKRHDWFEATMQKAKEAASNVAASAKASMDKTKAVVQEKVCVDQSNNETVCYFWKSHLNVAQ